MNPNPSGKVAAGTSNSVPEPSGSIVFAPSDAKNAGDDDVQTGEPPIAEHIACGGSRSETRSERYLRCHGFSDVSRMVEDEHGQQHDEIGERRDELGARPALGGSRPQPLETVRQEDRARERSHGEVRSAGDSQRN